MCEILASPEGSLGLDWEEEVIVMGISIFDDDDFLVKGCYHNNDNESSININYDRDATRCCLQFAIMKLVS